MGTGIPVPATIPEGSKAFIICVPDDPFFYGVVMGAIKQTTFRYYWNGTEEQKDAVTERMLRMYYEYQEQDGCMICEMIINCINSDPDTREALVNWFVNEAGSNPLIVQALNDAYNPLAQGADMPPAITAQAITGSNPTCNLDKLWGWIDGGIEAMNANNMDAFQVIEEKSNGYERVAALIGAIPGLGALPIDEAILYLQGLWSDDLFEAYEANDTTEYRRVLKCEIFCLARDNDCKVSVDLLYDYFRDRLEYTGDDVLHDIIAYLIEGTWAGTQINDAFYFMQVLWLKYGNRFFPITGLWGISTMFQLGEPSDDWTLLCEECPAEWCVEFTAGDGLDTLFAPTGGLGPQAVWTGTGWGANNAVTTARITLHADLGSEIDFQTVEMDFDIAPTGGNEDVTNLYSNGFATIIDTQANSTTVILTNDIPRQEFELDTLTSTDALGGGAVPILGECTAIRLRGFGTAPDLGTPC